MSNNTVATALVQDMLNRSHLWQENMALQRGLTPPPRLSAEVPEPAAAVLPVAAPLATAAAIASDPAKRSWLKTAATLGLMGLAGTGIGGLGTAAFMGALGLAQQGASGGGTTVVAPAASADRNASLLQYLEDQGLHVPPERRGQP